MTWTSSPMYRRGSFLFAVLPVLLDPKTFFRDFTAQNWGRKRKSHRASCHHEWKRGRSPHERKSRKLMRAGWLKTRQAKSQTISNFSTAGLHCKRPTNKLFCLRCGSRSCHGKQSADQIFSYVSSKAHQNKRVELFELFELLHPDISTHLYTALEIFKPWRPLASWNLCRSKALWPLRIAKRRSKGAPNCEFGELEAEVGWGWLRLAEVGWGWLRLAEVDWGWLLYSVMDHYGSMYQAGIFGQACRSNENISQHKIVALAAWAKQHEACPVTSSDLPSEQRGNALSQGQTKKTQPRKWRRGKPRMVQGLTAAISMLRSQQKNVKQTGLSLVQKTWCARVPLSFRLLSFLTKMDIRGIRNTVQIPPEPRSHQCPWLSMIFFHPCSCKEEANEEKKARTRGGYSSKSIKPRDPSAVPFC